MQETEKTKNQKIRRQNYFIKIAFVSLLVMLCSIVLFACFNISNPGWQTTTPYYPTDTTCTDSPYIDTVEPHRYFNLTVISGRDSGHFREGQSVAVMPASMPVRHTFIGWYENGERVSSLGFFRFTMPSRDKVLEAKFEYNPIPYFTLTVTGGAIWCSITQAGLSSGEFREGQRITLYLPYSTVFFIGWYENDQRVNSNHSFTFTMPARDVSLEARHHYWWLDTYRLDVINGYILGFGTYGYFLRDDWIEVRHTASIGSTTQRFLGWFEGEILLSTNYIFTFTMPSRDMTIEARVEEVLPIPEHMQVRWSYISAGRDHTLAIDTSGNLWAWGANWAGQLGNGTRIDRHSPIQIMIGTTFSALSAGGSHSLAIDTSGNLWAWGENWASQLGDGTIMSRIFPVKIKGDTAFTSVSAGGMHSLAIDYYGNLWSWGANWAGQLGDGTTINRHSPIQIMIGTTFSALSAGGSHSLAIDTSGNLWAWGENWASQLGNGTRIDSFSPIQIKQGTSFSAISAGDFHSLAIDTSSNLWVWGDNRNGQLGDGTTINRHLPIQIMIGTTFKAISAGLFHSLAIDTSGNLWVWGDNWFGQLGNGTTINRFSPIQIKQGTSFSAISAGLFHSLAIDTSGNIWAWGDNWTGQLGDGTTLRRVSPARIIVQRFDIFEVTSYYFVRTNWVTDFEIIRISSAEKLFVYIMGHFIFDGIGGYDFIGGGYIMPPYFIFLIGIFESPQFFDNNCLVIARASGSSGCIFNVLYVREDGTISINHSPSPLTDVSTTSIILEVSKNFNPSNGFSVHIS